MKKLLCVILAFILALSFATLLSGCNDPDEGAPGEDAPAEAVIPDGYQVYDNGDITFAYPEKWIKNDGSVTILVNETGIGNNISVAYEAKSDMYEKMDENSFFDQLAPVLSAAGMDVYDVSVEHLENGGKVKIDRIRFKARYAQVDLVQTLFCLTVGERTYAVTVTETEPVGALVNAVFDTLRVK